MQYLKVKNHDLYQHYGTRNPPWVKLYRVIMGDYDLRQVPVTARLCFIYCTILASETDNHIPYDVHFLSDRMGFKVTEETISALITRGLLLASRARRLLATEEKCSSLLFSSESSPILIPDLRSNGHAIPKKRSLRPISDDDKPSEKHFSFGKTLNVDVGPEWGKFKNYCLAHDKRYANFEAAFRNWLANAHTMKGGRA